MAKRMKEKALARRENADRRPQATARYVRISPSKVKIVLDIIRGKDYNEAMAILQGTPKAASEILIKILASAGANAENNLNLSKSDLYVAECFANSGPIYKRWWPRSHGSADTILKRTSHITIILDEKQDDILAKPVKRTAVTSRVDVNKEAKEEVKAEAAANKSATVKTEKAEKQPAKKPAAKATTKSTKTTSKTTETKATKTKTATKTTSNTKKGGAK